MEQDKLPCTPPDSPDYPCDREVFERVWRRVMPEDRPDCPFVLDEAAAALACAFPAALRERFAEEQRGELSYLAAAEETGDPCLRELYLELAGDENAHAWLLRGILEQL